jgi:DNA-binding GntR family transcriptional regulator
LPGIVTKTQFPSNICLVLLLSLLDFVSAFEVCLAVLQDVMKMSMETTLRLPGRSDISRSEHNEILSAIESGNGELASKLTLKHITGARATALADAKKKDSN